VVDTALLGKSFEMVDGEVKKRAAVSVRDAMACQFHVPDFATLEAVLSAVAEHTNAAITNCGWVGTDADTPDTSEPTDREIIEAAIDAHTGEQ